jgi:hypothetical protein
MILRIGGNAKPTQIPCVLYTCGTRVALASSHPTGIIGFAQPHQNYSPELQSSERNGPEPSEHDSPGTALNFRLIGLVHLVEIRRSHVGVRPTLGLISSDQTKAFWCSSEVRLDEADQIR